MKLLEVLPGLIKCTFSSNSGLARPKTLHQAVILRLLNRFLNFFDKFYDFKITIIPLCHLTWLDYLTWHYFNYIGILAEFAFKTSK